MNNATNPKNIQVGTIIDWYGDGRSLYTVWKIEGGNYFVQLNDTKEKYSFHYRLDNPPTDAIFKHLAPVSAPVITVKPALTPQAQTVLRHIRRAGSITQRQALMDHSVQSLTKAISIINAAGHKTKTTFKRHPLTNQRYAEYTLVDA